MSTTHARRPSFTDEEALEILRVFARANDGESPTVAEWAEEGYRPTSSWYATRFGSWRKAIEAAGLPARVMGQRKPRGKKNRGRPPMYTAADCITALQAWAREHGHAPTTEEWKGQKPSLPTICDRFGTWHTALTAAGLKGRASTSVGDGGAREAAKEQLAAEREREAAARQAAEDVETEAAIKQLSRGYTLEDVARETNVTTRKLALRVHRWTDARGLPRMKFSRPKLSPEDIEAMQLADPSRDPD